MRNTATIHQSRPSPVTLTRVDRLSPDHDILRAAEPPRDSERVRADELHAGDELWAGNEGWSVLAYAHVDGERVRLRARYVPRGRFPKEFTIAADRMFVRRVRG